MKAIYVVPTPSIPPAWDITLAQWVNGPPAGTVVCGICNVRFASPNKRRAKKYCSKRCSHIASYQSMQERLSYDES